MIWQSKAPAAKAGHYRRRGRVRRLFLALLAMTTIAIAAAAEVEDPQSRSAWRAKVDAWVLESAVRYGETEFLAYLDQQADLSAAATLDTKEEKGHFVFSRLKSTADRTQGHLLAVLTEGGVPHRSYWIANMIWIRGSLATVEDIASRPEVSRLFANPEVTLEHIAPDLRRAAATSTATAGASIVHTGAPAEFWDNGFAGEGVVIGGQDTGYAWQHPALISSYRGWDGQQADHDYNWHDAIHSGGGRCGADSPEPCDDGSHGTHTMGTMVGDDGAGNRIGMAPQARWIGCRNMDQGVGTPATYSECFQWFVAPTDGAGENPDPSRAPDVINNSWTCPEEEGCTDPNALRTVVANTRAAGILIVASAGNSGPGCSTIASPIALYDKVLTVGATDLGDGIAGFSSRGAVTADGSGRRKPDITAPGVGIRSSVPGDTYGLSNGTSMAGPHVAGMAALVLSAAECTRGKPRRLEKHLLESVLPRTAEQTCGETHPWAIPNNTYGHGILRAVLPTCARDGRIAGSTSRIDTSRVICRNRTSRDKTTIRVAGVNAWNCMARSLAASAGDKIMLKLTGSARHDGVVSGTVDGLATTRAICRNRTTGTKIRVPLAGSSSWDCESGGLAVEAGDRLKVTILGRATNDSR